MNLRKLDILSNTACDCPVRVHGVDTLPPRSNSGSDEAFNLHRVQERNQNFHKWEPDLSIE